MLIFFLQFQTERLSDSESRAARDSHRHKRSGHNGERANRDLEEGPGDRPREGHGREEEREGRGRHAAREGRVESDVRGRSIGV